MGHDPRPASELLSMPKSECGLMMLQGLSMQRQKAGAGSALYAESFAAPHSVGHNWQQLSACFPTPAPGALLALLQMLQHAVMP